MGEQYFGHRKYTSYLYRMFKHIVLDFIDNVNHLDLYLFCVGIEQSDVCVKNTDSVYLFVILHLIL